MSTGNRRRMGTALAAGAALSCMAPVWPAQAADFSFTLPAGIACPDFSLRIDGTNSPHRVFREFEDKDGNVVRIFEGGHGNDYLLTNVESGESVFVAGTGTASTTTVDANGVTTVQSSGHTGVVLYPTDVPLPGGTVPSSIFYTGRVVYTIDADGTYAMQSASGRTRDICAELS